MTDYIVVKKFKGNGVMYEEGDEYQKLGEELTDREMKLIPRYIREAKDGEPKLNRKELLAKKRKKEHAAPSVDGMEKRFGDLAEALKKAGFDTIAEVDAADDKELLAVKGIGKATLRRIRG